LLINRDGQSREVMTWTPHCPSQYDVSIIGTVGLPARYGGFETLVEQLVGRWRDRLRLLVYCTEVGAVTPRADTHEGADLRYLRWDANGWQSIVYDIAAMWEAARSSRTLLVLGVSGCVALPLIRLRAPRVRIVTHIDGLEWRRRKWGRVARAFLRFSEWMAVRFSDAVIADNQAIADHVRRSYGRDTLLIAYGGDHVLGSGTVHDAPPETRFAPQDYFLTICRIEPENNVREILEAFAATPAQRLVVVGNWSISPYALALRAEFGMLGSIELKDPIYDQTRLEGLRRNALGYVHGHSAGGTNPSLVEAMTMGLPVLAFDVDYNRFTTHDRAHYWADAAALAGLIVSIDGASLATNAAEMAALAASHYTWDVVAGQYLVALTAVDTKPD
jgi:glycosyltransferase involved in cell wall biosynthesis